MSLNFFAPNARLSIWLVILLYMTIVSYLEAVIWPTLYFLVVKLFHLYDVFSLSFLTITLNIVRLVFLYISAIILLAGCFNSNGLRVLLKNWSEYPKIEKKITEEDEEYEVVINRNKFYGSLLRHIIICMIILFVFAFVSTGIGFESMMFNGPQDPPDPRYLLLSSGSYAEYAALYVDFWPFTEGALWLRFGFLMGFCFLFAYHVLVPYSLIVGIQTHIWKMGHEHSQ